MIVPMAAPTIPLLAEIKKFTSDLIDIFKTVLKIDAIDNLGKSEEIYFDKMYIKIL